MSVADIKIIMQTYGKHLIGLIENEHLHGVGLQESALDHVVNTAWGTNDDLRTFLKNLHVLTNAGTTNAGVALNLHEIANSDNNLLNLLGQLASGGENQSLALLNSRVDLLESRDRESSSLASTRLGLGNNIMT